MKDKFTAITNSLKYELIFYHEQKIEGSPYTVFDIIVRLSNKSLVFFKEEFADVHSPGVEKFILNDFNRLLVIGDES